MPRPITIIDAPSNLGLMPSPGGREPGTRHAPDALRRLGLHDGLAPAQVLRVEAAPYDADEGRSVNIRNMAAIAEHAVRLADAVERTVADGAFALVLGGDCSLLLGSLLGLRRRGSPALLFLDGHTDFFLPDQSGTGGAAGMDLALATGWGPAALTDLEGLRPYVAMERVALLGNRDSFVRPAAAIPPAAETAMLYRDLAALRRDGAGRVTRQALDAITAAGGELWVHLDVDVLDGTLMPAVDSPQPDGLRFDELEDILAAALTAGAVGLQVTIYDPERDPDGRAGAALVDSLMRVLSRR